MSLPPEPAFADVTLANPGVEAAAADVVVSHSFHLAHPDWSRRIPQLDGLRGIAILLVLLRHSIFGMETQSWFLGKLLSAGLLSWSGVDLFFVLSGFLIGGILLDARESPRYFQTFYVRRFHRIFPLYFAVAGIFLFRHLPLGSLRALLGNVSPLTIPWGAYLTLTQNFWMAHLGWYGAPAMAVTWSLAVEEQFYLTVPFLIRKIRLSRLVRVLMGIIVAAPLLKWWLSHSWAHGNFASYVLMPCRADALCLGVLSAWMVRQEQIRNVLLARRSLLRGATFLLFLGIAWMTYRQWDQFSNAMVTFGYSWIALFYTGCLLLAVSQSRESSGVLTNPVLMRLGTLAYCSYLIHFPLVNAGHRIFATLWPRSGNAGWLAGSMLGLAATLLIATISWEKFEKPLLRRGHKHTY
jgi:peptidoglycan/LPS O-acetylase OafA/YrhL